MRLTSKQADVLAAIELRATLRVEEIREETGYRSHTIRYALSHLKQRDIIQRRPIINISALGYTMHNLYFSIGSGPLAVKQALIASFMEQEEVLRVTELGSEYQYCLGICAKSMADVGELLKRVTGKFKNISFKKAVSTQLATTLFPRRYLTSKTVRSKPIRIFVSENTHEIDQLDHEILRTISIFGDATRARIARELAIPVTTLDSRLKKLEARGILCGYIYYVSPAVYQMQSHRLLVQAKRFSSEMLDRIYDFSEQHPAVVHVTECLGIWDFEIGIEVRRPREVSVVTQELYEALGPEIHSIKTLSKYRDLKFHFYPVGRIESPEVAVAA